MAEREAREAIERAEQEKELRRMKEQNLAPEPAANEPNISKISIRLSDGTRLERRFLRSDTVQVRRPSFFCCLLFSASRRRCTTMSIPRRKTTRRTIFAPITRAWS